VSGAISVWINVTESERNQALLLAQATVDSVTGLANRSAFLEQVETEIDQCRISGESCALLLIDLDHFKRVNDSRGHEAGDSILIEVARRIVRLSRPSGAVARLGGDEFGILLSSFSTADIAEIADKVAQRILDGMRRPMEGDGISFVVTVSVGLALAPADGADVGILLRRADTALHVAKSDGRNRACFFNAEMDRRVQRRVSIEAQLRGALERGELSLVYQPIIDLDRGRATKAEALLRWFNPVLGHVPPDVFVPIAEENGQILPIGAWVLKQACLQARRWRSQLPRPLTVAVNVSAPQLHDDGFVGHVMQAVEEAGIEPDLLELEITERYLIGNHPRVRHAIQQLHDFGVALCLDDFGTGYSSLSYLTQYPFRTMKIDRAFLRDITTNPDALALAKAIIAMGRNLKLSLVAEGVEEFAPAQLLHEFGCALFQGFYFCRPAPPELMTIDIQRASARAG
jgi:diguanylate cyclase (GGDEF)-like protein